MDLVVPKGSATSVLGSFETPNGKSREQLILTSGLAIL